MSGTPAVDTNKYLAVNELEQKGAWIRWFKFANAAFAVFALISGTLSAVYWILHAFLSLFLMGSAIAGLWEAIVFGLQAKAIQNADFDLQKKVSYFFYINLIALPAWATFGPILDASLPSPVAGVCSLIFCAIMLYCSHQVKNVFEGKGTFALKKDEITKPFNA